MRNDPFDIIKYIEERSSWRYVHEETQEARKYAFRVKKLSVDFKYTALKQTKDNEPRFDRGGVNQLATP